MLSGFLVLWSGKNAATGLKEGEFKQESQLESQ
jgi:hypothetical protein